LRWQTGKTTKDDKGGVNTFQGIGSLIADDILTEQALLLRFIPGGRWVTLLMGKISPEDFGMSTYK
jgi:hypothetical protein